MKLLTLNTHSWQENNQQQKIETLANVIVEQQYDVIAIQEVSQLIHSTPLGENPTIHQDNYGYLLLNELRALGCDDYRFCWAFAHIGYDIFEEGVAILTKHPIISQEMITLTNQADSNSWKSRVALKLTLSYDEMMIDVYSCHLGFWEDAEEPSKLQFKQLLASTTHERLTFLLGDFNSEASKKNQGYSLMKKQGWFDTYLLANKKDQGTTVSGAIAGWSQNHKDKRIDYIFTNQKLDVIQSQTIFNGINEPIISDHFGIHVNINL
ncbi:endonuclease/exonuclease/phosphatase family protein [Amphibacillus jilinensis]|uniref:endonuclease/exonuclease/phosphatase family protein n=1 Tax=Amphibacillus jilinensis TaxID=1216008 RepID=UPI0003113F6E|nr:endonuclease/exonuclease/phosphatase family protein [Amphibacillus jilinensis]